MPYLSSLSLTAFRNYEAAAVRDLENGFVILVGENGAGKTNCVEAVSLLSPGRGLRGASLSDCQSQRNQTSWVVGANLVDRDGDSNQLGVGRDPSRPDKKIIRYNGETVKSQSDLGNIMRAVWLTPQMDGLFLAGASERRRFLDRLVATFDPAHTGRLTRYEKATRQRLNLLKTATEKGAKADATWLSALETVMAETGVTIAVARMEFLSRMDKHLHQSSDSPFPAAAIAWTGDVETGLKNRSALQAEDDLKDRLYKSRRIDGETGRTHHGVHKTDMAVTHVQKSAAAAICSTGEQKGLLTTIILSHAQMIKARYGTPPILIFDEIAAHFDATKRAALYDILADLGGQVWLTGQDAQAFQSIPQKQLIRIAENQFFPCE